MTACCGSAISILPTPPPPNAPWPPSSRASGASTPWSMSPAASAGRPWPTVRSPDGADLYRMNVLTAAAASKGGAAAPGSLRSRRDRQHRRQRRGQGRRRHGGPYAASKAGVHRLTESLGRGVEGQGAGQRHPAFDTRHPRQPRRHAQRRSHDLGLAFGSVRGDPVSRLGRGLGRHRRLAARRSGGCDPPVEHLDVLVVGAGISGISAGYHLQTMCPGRTFAIFEGREAIGGTWDLFRYPGIRSDSDMFTLGFQFKPWTQGQGRSPTVPRSWPTSMRPRANTASTGVFATGARWSAPPGTRENRAGRWM